MQTRTGRAPLRDWQQSKKDRSSDRLGQHFSTAPRRLDPCLDLLGTSGHSGYLLGSANNADDFMSHIPHILAQQNVTGFTTEQAGQHWNGGSTETIATIIRSVEFSECVGLSGRPPSAPRRAHSSRNVTGCGRSRPMDPGHRRERQIERRNIASTGCATSSTLLPHL